MEIRTKFVNTISLTFSNPDLSSELRLDWNILSHGLAQKWAQEMHRALCTPRSIREQKFFGWGPQRDQEIVNKLNESIACINSHFGSRYQIKERAYREMGQASLNALHHHFELLMGQSWKRSDFLEGAPLAVHLAVRALNDLVHELEFSAGAKSNRLNGGFQIQLVPYRQLDLSTDDLLLFSYENEPGNLVSSYCQLGKTWADVYLDGDEDIHPENISPLRFYSSSFVANFFHCSKIDAENFRGQVQEFMRKRSQAAGAQLDVDHPKHALGYATYATPAKHSPLHSWSDSELKDFFANHGSVTKMEILLDGSKVHKNFPVRDTFEGEPLEAPL